MAQQKAFGPTSVEGGSHASEHWVTLLVRLDVLLDQIGLILLLGVLTLGFSKITVVKKNTWLVGGFNSSEIYDIVNWDDYSKYVEK